MLHYSCYPVLTELIPGKLYKTKIGLSSNPYIHADTCVMCILYIKDDVSAKTVMGQEGWDKARFLVGKTVHEFNFYNDALNGYVSPLE